MYSVFEDLERIGIVPVIKIDDAEKAVPLAKALAAGGIPCIEITFRTAEGEEALRRISAQAPEILAGAGTVLTTGQVDMAIGAGARFVVSPGLNPQVVSYCQKKGMPVIPGCATPSDIEAALGFGLDLVKFFPAEQAGGLEYIKAIAAPYTTMKFIPTGGINAGNIGKYTAYDRIVACGGSWMANIVLVNSGDFSEITALSRKAVFSMLGFEFIEMADDYITIATNSITKAAAFLQRSGIAFTDTNSKVICLTEKYRGLAIHLVKK